MVEGQEVLGQRERQLQILADCDLLEPDGDADLAAAARLAAALSGYATAMVNVLLPQVTCSLARVGGVAVPMVREESLCHRASQDGGPVVSKDCTTDPRFADLPTVDGRLGIVRRYAMAPLQVDSVTVGSLCVLDERPGDDPDDALVQQLLDLAAMTSSLLERRRQTRRALAAHAQLDHTRAFDAALLQALPVGVAAADADRRLVHLSDALCHWWGTEAAHLSDLAAETGDGPLFEADGTTPVPPERDPLARVFEEGSVCDAEYVVRPTGRASRAVIGSGVQVRDAGGQLLGAVVVLNDVTDQRNLEAQLRAAATHDVLTGLPNRALLVQRLLVALSEASEAEAERVAVLFCDLDRFKAVNDTFGHAAGDAVLMAVAGRLSASLRPQDLVARLGGDEFAIVCPGMREQSEVDALTLRLGQAVAEPLNFKGEELRVGVSVGAVLSLPGEGCEGAERLLGEADTIMYARKRARRESRASTPDTSV